MKYIIKLILILCYTSIAFAQSKSDTLVYEPTKHQLGIGISKFVNSAFPSDVSAFLLEYRYHPTEKLGYRIAADYDFQKDEYPVYTSGLKLGFDKQLKRYSKWNFYYGIDLWGRYTFYGKEKRKNTTIALNPFFGIAYYFSKNFSISTEPGIYFKSNYFIDEATFDPNNEKKGWESRLSKVGYLQLNFHF